MTDRLFDLLEPTVRGLGYDLLGIDRGRNDNGQLIRLYIDHDDGIVVDDCEKVSRQVSDLLDVDGVLRGAYTLEVSSPGLDRPLFTLDQHRQWLGSPVRIRLRMMIDGRRRLAGVLTDVHDDTLVVEVDGAPFEVPFPAVERSRLAVDWDAEKGA